MGDRAFSHADLPFRLSLKSFGDLLSLKVLPVSVFVNQSPANVNESLAIAGQITYKDRLVTLHSLQEPRREVQ